MEEENNVIKEEKKGNYLTGIIGAIIGGAIAAIPWVFVYVEGGMILSVLAILIALGALTGYKICKGKMTKALKPIIAITSLVIVTVTTIFVIPEFLAQKNDVTVEYLYDSDEFMNAILRDLAISLIFTVLGISAAMASINRALIESDGIKNEDEITKKAEELQRLQIDSKLKGSDKENIKILRDTFDRLDANNRDKAIEKEKIISEMNCNNAEEIFKKYSKKNIIQKYKGKYFYNSQNEVMLTNNYWIWFLVIIIIIGVSAGLGSTGKNNSSNNTKIEQTNNIEYKFEDDKLSVSIPEDWIEYESDYTYLYSVGDEVDVEGIDFYVFEKDEFEEYQNEEEYIKYIESLVKENYADDNPNLKVENVTIAGKSVYKLTYNYVLEGFKYTSSVYVISTENYIIEADTYASRSQAEDKEKIFEAVLNTIKEK